MLVDQGAFQQRKKYSRDFAKILKRSQKPQPPDSVLHHYLPLDDRFEIKFLKAGLDPNDPNFTDWADTTKHTGWHKGSGRGGDYNKAWADFFDPLQNPNQTTEDILNELSRLKEIYPPLK